MRSILHVMNYAASYRGNFIDSLERLNERLKQEGMHNIYLFTDAAKNEGAMKWIKGLEEQGETVAFMDGIVSSDKKIIKNMMEQYDVAAVHTHFITMEQYLPVYFATMFSKVPVFMHMHNHSRQAGNPVKNILRRFLYRKCKMIACSESVFKSLERDYPANEKYAVDNGVNFARLDNYETITNADYNIAENEKAFLIFGFDFYRKGVDLAVKALDKLRKEGHPYSLLVSLSVNFEYVEEQIISILGELPDWVHIIPARNDVATLYNFVDLFLSPSREEGLPYSVIEAGYSKCSVVLSDISAQVNLKVPYAEWFESENVDMFAEKILKAEEEHQNKLNDMDNVRKKMMENYDLDNWSKKIEAIYHKTLK